MFPTTPMPTTDLLPVTRAARSMMEVMAELVAVMTEENRMLAAGFPAGLTELSERKLELTDEYADLWEQMSASAANLRQDPDFVHEVIEAVSELRRVAGENMARLEAATAASRRRVEAVLDAMRTESAEARPYDAKGSIPLAARLPASRTAYHA